MAAKKSGVCKDGKRRGRKPIDRSWHAGFLEAYARLGVIGEAAKECGVNACMVREHRLKDKKFEELVKVAADEAVEHLEAEVYRRAVAGVEEPVFYRGAECGSVRKYSDTLLIFRLKALRPEMYRDRSTVEISGQIAVQMRQQIQAVIDHLKGKLSPNAFNEVLKALADLE